MAGDADRQFLSEGVNLQPLAKESRLTATFIAAVGGDEM
jgi:hypothetical protein